MTVTKVSFSFDTSLVTHHVSFPSSPPSPLSMGDTYSLEVDAAHRATLSAYHSAGHLVDSAIYRLGYDYLKPSKGYHFVDGPYVEYNNGKTMPEAERKTLPERLNEQFAQLCNDDIPTTVCMMAKEDAEEHLNGCRLQKNFDLSAFKDPTVRIVGIAGFTCPCGGTHVASSAMLKDFEVTGIKMKKGDLRVKYGKKKP